MGLVCDEVRHPLSISFYQGPPALILLLIHHDSRCNMQYLFPLDWYDDRIVGSSASNFPLL